MGKRRTVLAFAAFTAVALITAACSKEGGGGNTIKLGFIGDLTGGNAGLVVSSNKAAKLAIKKANDSGDLSKKIELVSLDNKDGNPDPVAALAQKLINDKDVVGVIGPAFSGETNVAGPLFADAGLTHITQSATRPDLTTHGWKTFFRALANDGVQGPDAGKLMVRKLGAKRVAIVNDKSDYGSGLAPGVATGVTSSGGQVVLNQGVEPTTDYSSIVQSLLSANPDAIFYSGYDKDAPLLFKQYREKGGKAKLVGGDGDKGTNFLKEGGSAVDGAVLTCPCLDPNASTDAAAQAFAKEYKDEYGEEAGIYSSEGWDVADIFIAAIKSGGDNVTRESVLNYVTKLKDFKGLSKVFNWTKTHEVVNGNVTFAYEVKGGKYTLLGKVADLTK